MYKKQGYRMAALSILLAFYNTQFISALRLSLAEAHLIFLTYLKSPMIKSITWPRMVG